MYDWWLGGKHNFRADQDAARALITVEPKIRAMARINRDAAIRTHEAITRFFDDFTLVEPGLVWASQWRPDCPRTSPKNPPSTG